MEQIQLEPERSRQIRNARRGQAWGQFQTLVGVMDVIWGELLLVPIVVGYMNLEVLDGVILTPGVSLPVVPTRTITAHDIVPLQRNGPAECDISLMHMLGERDCVVVALNNLAGDEQYSRHGMAALEARFASGDMPSQLICRAISPLRQQLLPEVRLFVGAHDALTVYIEYMYTGLNGHKCG